MDDNADTDIELFSNKVTIPIEPVINKILSGIFNQVSFPDTPDVPLILERQTIMREIISDKFGTHFKPDVYAIMVLLFMYQLNPDMLFMFDTWEDVSDKLAFDISMDVSGNPTQELKLQCLCGCKIDKVFKIHSNDQYAIMGRICILKSSIYNQSELNKIERITCTIFRKNCPRPKPYDLSQDVCKRCLDKQHCVDCNQVIPKNEINIRCKPCYFNKKAVRQYAQRHSKGLCLKCSKPIETKYTYCYKCNL